MRKFFTDKFLWDLYKIFEGAGGVADFVFSSSYKKAWVIAGDQNPLFYRYEKELGRKKFHRLINILKQNNYIRSESLKGKQAMMLTKEGFSKALKASFAMEEKKKRKDGKWLMLTFDIPQKHKKARELLRGIMRNLGYKMFQQSIWVCPFDVSDTTEKLLQMHNLEKYVKIFLIEEL